jgi:hypothetical protein
MANYILGLGLGLIIGALIEAEWGATTFQADLIQRGLAMHCPIDGHFAYNGECDNISK